MIEQRSRAGNAAVSTGHRENKAGRVEERAQAEGAGCVMISAKIEAEFAGLPDSDRAEFLKDLGLA